MAAIHQSDYRDKLLATNRAAVNRIRDAVGSVGPEVLTRHPRQGGWSIAEVLEHLIVAADSYLDRLRPIVEKGDAHTAAPDATWKPTLVGGLLVGSFRSPRRMRAPRMYRPGPTPRPRALEQFIERHEELSRLITKGGRLEWTRIHMRSPVIPLIRMNLGDAFAVLVVHAERHAGQIERLKAITAEVSQ